jgi:hypothetical protein
MQLLCIVFRCLEVIIEFSGLTFEGFGVNEGARQAHDPA